MLKNKKGLSEVVMTVIMIVLVLVAVGIIWVVIQNILDRSSSNIDYTQKCLGLAIEPTKIACFDLLPENQDGSAGDGIVEGCSVTIERSSTSVAEPIGGVQVVLTDGTNTLEIMESSDIPVSKEVVHTFIESETPFVPSKASVRIFFKDSKYPNDMTKVHFCNTITSYPN